MDDEGIDDEEQAAENQIEADLSMFVILPTTFAMINHHEIVHFFG